MKKYIKLNNNDNHLSLGNFTRIIKENTINKTSALQTEVFSTLFNTANINDTTINNYCIGIRSINNDYKQQYIIYKKNYPKDNYILLDIIINLLTIITGNIYSNLTKKEKIDLINMAKDKLTNYMMPNKVIKIEKMPYNANGKIDRNLLKKMNEEEI